MGKLYFIVIVAVGVFFYANPEQFDILRGEAEVKVSQTVTQTQEQVSESLIGVIQNTGDDANE